MAHVDGPLGTGCKRHTTGGLISLYFHVSTDEKQEKKTKKKREKNPVKHLKSFLPLGGIFVEQ